MSTAQILILAVTTGVMVWLIARHLRQRRITRQLLLSTMASTTTITGRLDTTMLEEELASVRGRVPWTTVAEFRRAVAVNALVGAAAGALIVGAVVWQVTAAPLSTIAAVVMGGAGGALVYRSRPAQRIVEVRQQRTEGAHHQVEQATKYLLGHLHAADRDRTAVGIVHRTVESLESSPGTDEIRAMFTQALNRSAGIDAVPFTAALEETRIQFPDQGYGRLVTIVQSIADPRRTSQDGELEGLLSDVRRQQRDQLALLEAQAKSRATFAQVLTGLGVVGPFMAFTFSQVLGSVGGGM